MTQEGPSCSVSHIPALWMSAHSHMPLLEQSAGASVAARGGCGRGRSEAVRAEPTNILGVRITKIEATPVLRRKTRRLPSQARGKGAPVASAAVGCLSVAAAAAPRTTRVPSVIRWPSNRPA